MIVAFDYDKTWTRDPEAWRLIAEVLRVRGHTCVLVTSRVDAGQVGAEVRRAIGSIMPIVFAAHGWKREAAEHAGFEVDVWIDDMPESITPASPLLRGGV